MDFTRPVGRGFYAVVIPLKSESNMWYFIDPFQHIVWILILFTIPMYTVAMGLADYVFMGFSDWDTLCGFVIRNALSENNSISPNRSKAYQKIFIIVWASSIFVLVQSYAGNLTAMLAKPKLQTPIRTLDELINQDEISWVLEEKTVAEFYMKTSQTGTTMKKLYNGATLMPSLTPQEQFTYGCYASKLRGSGNFASICDVGLILPMYAKDFRETGKCNFYILEEKFLSSVYAMALQVSNKYFVKQPMQYITY